MISRDHHGPWAVIAGGSEGVGACFARQLASAGINILLLARGASGIEAIAAELRAAHQVEVRTLAVDLTAPDMLASIRSASAGLEVGTLIYNAGAAQGPGWFLDEPVETAHNLVALNQTGLLTLTHHFGMAMAKRGRGAIIMVGSAGCSAGAKRLATYAAVKAFTQIFAEGLWAELEPQGVDVAALIIGRTRTPALIRTELDNPADMPAADPADVVAFAIENLHAGPVLVYPDAAQGFDALRSMPRLKAVKIMTRSLEGQT